MLEFKHAFAEDPPHSDLSVEITAENDEKIAVNIENGKNIWLSANKAGWLHLARICAELGTRELEPGYHFHLTFEFKSSDGKGQEISFEVAD
jgi:hypothetical protein